jgi:hypothetical protein
MTPPGSTENFLPGEVTDLARFVAGRSIPRKVNVVLRDWRVPESVMAVVARTGCDDEFGGLQP